MGQTLSNYDAALQEFYGMAIQETLNNEVMCLKYLEKSTKKYDGRRVVFPAHSGRNVGVGARAESAALPTAGNQKLDSVYVTAAYIYGRVDLTGQTMKAAGKTAFATALAYELEGAKTDLVFDIGRQSYGEGLGILAQGIITSTLTSVYVANRYAEPGQPGARFIQAGQLLAFGSNAAVTTTLTSQAVVSTTIAKNSGTTYDIVTFSASVNLSACSFLYNNLAGGAGVEIKGLRAIVDDQTASNCYGLSGGFYNNDTIFGINRGTVKGWNSYVDQNAGVERLIDSYVLQKNMTQAKKASGMDIDIMFAEYDVVDAFWDSVAGDRRFNSKNFDAGVETLTFNGKTMVKDLLAPYNTLFGLNRKGLKWYEMCPVEFADDDGNVLKNVSGYDRFEAFLRTFIQLAPGEEAAPNSMFRIEDIKVDLA